MRGIAAVLVLAGACGAVSGSQGDVDASTSGVDAPIDGLVDAPPSRACDPQAAFTTVENLSALNSTADEVGFWLSPDGRDAYISSSRPGGVGGYDIYVAHRDSVEAAFATPTLVPVINSTAVDGLPILTADQRTIYITSRRTGDSAIFVATRSDAAQAFGTPEALLSVDIPQIESEATFINAAGTRMYISARPVTGTSDAFEMYRAERPGRLEPFQAPVAVGELNSAVEDWGMFLTDDELTVYFESTRPPSRGCNDVYKATRSTVNDGFGQPTKVDELSTALCEWPVWVSPDGCQLVLAIRDRAGGLGGYDLWIAKKPAL